MQQKLTKKLVATTLGLVLIIAMIFCIVPIQPAYADEIIWEKIDYEKYFVVETIEDGTPFAYGIDVKDAPYLRKFKYLYVFLQGNGGMGGNSIDGKSYGYGGGSGAFAVIKLTISAADNYLFLLGFGGGKFEYTENSEYENGDGMPTLVMAARGATATKPFALETIVFHGGKLGSDTAPGAGGKVSRDITTESLMSLIYAQNGADGGQASHSFSVDLGFRTEHFIYRPTGANPSGKGGGASVYHRGGDGGVMFKNGANGTMGAGGGGAGKGATQGGYGGDAYMEIYGSNM